MDCTSITQEVIIALITSLISSATIIFAGYQTYLNAIKKLHKESIENIERAKYEAILKAHQSIINCLGLPLIQKTTTAFYYGSNLKAAKRKFITSNKPIYVSL